MQAFEEKNNNNSEDAALYANLQPLDEMRKVRRDIVRTINELRASEEKPEIYLDPMTNLAANEYAKLLLQKRAW